MTSNQLSELWDDNKWILERRPIATRTIRVNHLKIPFVIVSTIFIICVANHEQSKISNSKIVELASIITMRAFKFNDMATLYYSILRALVK